MTDNTSMVRAIIAAENAAHALEGLPKLTPTEERELYRWGATAPRDDLRYRIAQANAVTGFRRSTAMASDNQRTRISELERYLYGEVRVHPGLTYAEASGMLQHLSSVRRDVA